MEIKLKGNWASREVWLNGKKLNPAKSQKLWNHSPDGFNWGYGGSGPAQLALAICIELYGMPSKYESPLFNHHDFKFRYIAALPQSDFDVMFEVPSKEEIILDKWKEDEKFVPGYSHARYKDQDIKIR